MKATKYDNFTDFYQFYLTEHINPTNRILHFTGSTIGLCFLIYALVSKIFGLIFAGIIAGYFFAWVGHFVFEKNRPASFKQPIYSFMGDWVMWFQLITGKQKFAPNKESN